MAVGLDDSEKEDPKIFPMRPASTLPDEEEEQVLPRKQVFAIWFTQTVAGIHITLPFTLAVYMVRSFFNHGDESHGVDEKTVATLTGLLAACMSGANFLSSYPWGIFSDRFGRKVTVLIGTLSSAICMLTLGLSQSYPAAFLSRFFAGFLNGIGVATNTMIGESMTPVNQALVMGYGNLGWGIGNILGPVVGGYCSVPCETMAPWFPLCGPGQLFLTRPFLLPCLVAGGLAFLAFLIDMALMEETHPRLQHRRWGSGLPSLGSGLQSLARYRRLGRSEEQEEPDTIKAWPQAGPTGGGAEGLVQANSRHPEAELEMATWEGGLTTPRVSLLAVNPLVVALNGQPDSIQQQSHGVEPASAAEQVRQSTPAQPSSLSKESSTCVHEAAQEACIDSVQPEQVSAESTQHQGQPDIGRSDVLSSSDENSSLLANRQRGPKEPGEQALSGAGKNIMASVRQQLPLQEITHTNGSEVAERSQQEEEEELATLDASLNDEQAPLVSSAHSTDAAAQHAVKGSSSRDAEAGGLDADALDVPEVPWYRQTTLQLCLLGAAMCAFLSQFFQELTPVFAAAPVDTGGLGMPAYDLAFPMSVSGVILIFFSLLGYPWLIKRLGPLSSCKLGMLIGIPPCFVVPSASLLLGLPTLRSIVLCLGLGCRGLAALLSLSSTAILVNALAPKAQMGAVNGAAASTQALVRSLGPACGGSAWAIAVAMSKVPYHQFLPYLFVAVCYMLVRVMYGRVQISMPARRASRTDLAPCSE